MNYLLLLAASIVVFTVVVGYLKRKSISKWIKKNKKKSVAIGTSIAVVLAGASGILLDVAGSGSAPTITDISPADGSNGNSLSLTWSATVEDPEGDAINWSIECSNGQSESADGSLPYNAETLPNDNGGDPDDDLTLKWEINVYTEYNFEPESFPSTLDIDGDGIQEIFLGDVDRTDGSTIKFWCLYGQNGTEKWNRTIGDKTNNNYYCMVYDFVDSNPGFEVIPSCGDGTQYCLDADTGEDVWTSTDYTSGWHQQGFIDHGDGDVILYMVDGEGDDATEGLFKVYASNGSLIKKIPYNYTCWGGISIADCDHDGDYEIFVNGRYTPNSGIKCLDEDLNYIWNNTGVVASSQAVMLANVTGDSDLEVISIDQLGDDKGYILYSNNGTVVSSSSNAYDGVHCQPALGRTKGDGSYQLFSVAENTDDDLQVWNVTSAGDSIFQSLTGASGDSGSMVGPSIVDVIDDPEGLPEILSYEAYGSDAKFWIWNSTSVAYEAYSFTSDDYTNVHGNSHWPHSSPDTITSAIECDIDYDGYKELLVYRCCTTTVTSLLCYETAIPIQNPRPVTNIEFGGMQRLNDNTYYELPGNSSLSYTYIANNGTKSIDLVGLIQGNEYTIWINTTDGNTWNNDTYTFITEATALVESWDVVTDIVVGASHISKDIDGDDIHEIFIAGSNVTGGDTVTTDLAIRSINGSDGSTNWEYDSSFYNVGTEGHVPMCIGDLDNDGNYELAVAARTNTLVLNCEDGSVFWNSTVNAGWHHMAIIDVDQNNLPYLYTSCAGSVDGSQRITKFYGSNGTVAAQVYHYYSCNGGISAADLDRDGDIEIIASDRAGSDGRTSRCYDEDLVPVWNASDSLGNGVTASSHNHGLIDVTGDRDLEVVGLKQGTTGVENGGVWVVYGNNGTEFYYDSDTDMGCHVVPNYWDMDEDGNVEVRSSFGTTDKIWDLIDQSLDAENGDWTHANSGISGIANVMGDDRLEIIHCNAATADDLYLYTTSYDEAHMGDHQWGGYTIVQDVDGDGLSEIVSVHQSTNHDYYDLRCYDTFVDAPSPRVRTDTAAYSERRLGAAVYIASLAPKWWATITNDGVDYFTWLGPNVTISTVTDRMVGFDESDEYLAIWDNGTWSSTHANWLKYYGDESGTDFTLHTFDVIHTYMTDSGTQKIGMDENVEIDYDAQRVVSLTDVAANKGYNYIGYTDDDVSTLNDVVDKSTLSSGESGLWWNRTSFTWETWIVGFTPATMDHDTSENDVFIMKVSATRSIDIGD